MDKPKIFICTPAFEGKVHVQYAIALADSISLLRSMGVQCETRLTASGSILCAERNRLTEAFLKTDCTHMMCIDSDLGWNPHAMANLFKRDMDFVAGCYPARAGKVFIFRPILKEDGSVVADPVKQLIQMEYIPAGFMLIKRHVIEKMREDNPDLYFKPKINKPGDGDGYALFLDGLLDGEFWGEDYHFCRIARKSGFEIWVDPMIEFDHAGVRGMLAETLTNDKEKAAPKIIE